LPQHGTAWRWALLALGGCLVLLAVRTLGVAPLAAQEGEEETAISRELRIKAAYLYQFGRYIEWPPKTFATPQSPFVVGVMERDPIISDLDQIARAKKIQDRTIRIRRFSSAANVQPCHILYLPTSMSQEEQTEAIRRVSGKGVLLVGEADGFLEWGGVVRFVVEENKVRMVIARKAAKRERLAISAKLLQVARVVD
jgi:hypothetical protein